MKCSSRPAFPKSGRILTACRLLLGPGLVRALILQHISPPQDRVEFIPQMLDPLPQAPPKYVETLSQCEWSPESSMLAVWAWTIKKPACSLRIYRVSEAQLLFGTHMPNSHLLRRAPVWAWSPDSKRLAFSRMNPSMDADAGWDGLLIWDAASRQIVVGPSFLLEVYRRRELQWSACSKWLLTFLGPEFSHSMSCMAVAQLVDAQQGSLIYAWEGETARLKQLHPGRIFFRAEEQAMSRFLKRVGSQPAQTKSMCSVPLLAKPASSVRSCLWGLLQPSLHAGAFWWMSWTPHRVQMESRARSLSITVRLRQASMMYLASTLISIRPAALPGCPTARAGRCMLGVMTQTALPWWMHALITCLSSGAGWPWSVLWPRRIFSAMAGTREFLARSSV